MQREGTGATQVLAPILQHALPLTEVDSTLTPEDVKVHLDILHHRAVRLVVEGQIQEAQEVDLRVAQVERPEAEITKSNSNPK